VDAKILSKIVKGKRAVPEPLFISLPTLTCTEARRTMQGRE